MVDRYGLLIAGLIAVPFLICVPSVPGQVLEPERGEATQAGQERGGAPNDVKTTTFSADRIMVVTDVATLNELLAASPASQDGAARGAPSGTGEPKESTEPPLDLGSVKHSLEAQWHGFVAWSGLKAWKVVFLFVGLIVTFLAARFCRWLVEHYAARLLTSKTKTDIDDLMCEAVGKPLGLLVTAIGIFASVLPLLLSMSGRVFTLGGRLCLALGACAIAWGVYRLVVVVDRVLKRVAARTDNYLDDMIVGIIRKAIKVTIVILAVLLIGQNILGMNITALLAGAGVVGLAVAFAAQDTIANFFGSIMIILDKPFSDGDRIVVGGYDGVVEHVGFRSSRIRTLTGHLVTIPNKTLADSMIENVGARPYLKWETNLTLVYDTPPEQMARAIEILHEILDSHEGVREDHPPRILFDAFNDWALSIAVTVWYHPADYAAYLRWKHLTNMEILTRFNAADLEFAFPTNTTYLANDPKRTVEMKVTS